jgi:hypothetical protein
MKQVRALVGSVRFWAIAMSILALVGMLLPSSEAARLGECGPCGAGACMGPTGCVSQYTTICYNNVLLQCQFNYARNCSEFVQTGYCG